MGIWVLTQDKTAVYNCDSVELGEIDTKANKVAVKGFVKPLFKDLGFYSNVELAMAVVKTAANYVSKNLQLIKMPTEEELVSALNNKENK